MLKLLRLAYSNASFVVGVIIGSAGLASNTAAFIGIDLIGFPGILVGYYRTLVSQLFFWSPEWWPEWLSHTLTLYFSLGLSLARAATLVARRGASILRMLSHTLFWPFELIVMVMNKRKHESSAQIAESQARSTRSGMDYGMSGSAMMSMLDYEYEYNQMQYEASAAARYIYHVLIVTALTPIFALLILVWSGLQRQLGL